MSNRAQQSRDAALRRLSRVNRSLAAAALLGTAVITDVVANTASGHSRTGSLNASAGAGYKPALLVSGANATGSSAQRRAAARPAARRRAAHHATGEESSASTSASTSGSSQSLQSSPAPSSVTSSSSSSSVSSASSSPAVVAVSGGS